ncbi:MAG: amino acid ABC transporter substrate-binding protein [Leifsonia sp.]|nr:amino acid ABC transporter substrate-binding protein [Leifsonia sp.]|tara:strand:+ start:15407 stop:16246 length:840 start_codon:yes stop_codon:yes gene_type:complete
MPRSARHRTAARAVALLAAASLTAGLAACQTTEAASDYVTEGKLTIGTGEPAYYPYVIDDAPESGEGFEAAIAYAVAAELGFDAADVVWVRTTFEEAIAPGPKSFDFNLQQYTITEERAESVDFSSPYYATPQAVITVDSTAVAGATTVAELADALVGAASGSTSLAAAESAIAPTAGVQVFNSNDDAVLALQTGQIDALVVDLPTAFYLVGVVLEGGELLGQLPADEGVSDEWGLVLPKDSALTAEVTAAVDALREAGTLDDIAATWLGAGAGAPVLQ